MEIDTKMNPAPIDGPTRAKRSSVPSAADDGEDFTSSTALEGALQQVPDVRPEAVSRARALISDQNYPSATTVRKLSDFLASQLQPSVE